MVSLAAVWAFVVAHDWQIVLVGSYVLLNVGPRPHPETMTGPKKVFWTIVDRLSVLSAERVPGNWKMIFAPSPSADDGEGELEEGERPGQVAPAELVRLPASEPVEPRSEAKSVPPPAA